MLKFESVADVRFITNLVLEKTKKRYTETSEEKHKESHKIDEKYIAEIGANALSYEAKEIQTRNIRLHDDNEITVIFEIPEDVLFRWKQERKENSDKYEGIQNVQWQHEKEIREWRDAVISIMCSKRRMETEKIPYPPDFINEYLE